MASTQVVAAALISLRGVQHKEITPVMTESFVFALRDVSDADVAHGVGRALETLKFYPSPGEFRALCGGNSVPIDIASLCKAIQSKGHYHANVGWINPPTRVVIEHFGPEIGAAYAIAGASRIFSDNETSLEIARRDFQNELAKHPPAKLEKWLVTAKPERLLPPGDRPQLALPAPRRIKGPIGPDWSDLKAKQLIESVANAHTVNEK